MIVGVRQTGLMHLGLDEGVFGYPVVVCCLLHVFFWSVAHCFLVMSFFLMIGRYMCWLIPRVLLRVILVAKDMVLGLGVDFVVAL